MSAAATLGADGVPVAIGCVSAVPERARAMRSASRRRADEARAPRAPGLGASSTRRGRARIGRLPASPRRGAASARCWRPRSERGDERVASRGSRSPVEINGTIYERDVAARRLLVHFIRDDCDLTGTTRLRHGQLWRVHGAARRPRREVLHAARRPGGRHAVRRSRTRRRRRRADALQQAFSDHHALQCGYCTPGMLMSATALLDHNPSPSEDEIKAPAGQHLPLHRLLEHRWAVKAAAGGGAGAREHGAPELSSAARSSASVPRKEDGRLVQGQGVFVDDISATTWVTSTSSARRTRMHGSSRSTSPPRSRRPAFSGR